MRQIGTSLQLFGALVVSLALVACESADGESFWSGFVLADLGGAADGAAEGEGEGEPPPLGCSPGLMDHFNDGRWQDDWSSESLTTSVGAGDAQGHWDEGYIYIEGYDNEKLAMYHVIDAPCRPESITFSMAATDVDIDGFIVAIGGRDTTQNALMSVGFQYREGQLRVVVGGDGGYDDLAIAEPNRWYRVRILPEWSEHAGYEVVLEDCYGGEITRTSVAFAEDPAELGWVQEVGILKLPGSRIHFDDISML